MKNRFIGKTSDLIFIKRVDDAFNEADHPRNKDGEFTPKGGGSEDSLEGYSKNAKLKHGVIYTDDVYDAVKALHENRRVELNQPKQVSTLIEKLGEVTKEMVAQGKDAPVFDLCNVSIKGTNLFCADTLGIPRIKMPQLDGKQTAAFVEHLSSLGLETQEGVEPSKNLRATQGQLDGGKVARMAQRLLADPGGRADSKRIVISRDNYILDGHHHWAGQIAVDAMDDNLGGHKTNVTRVNISIIDLYRRAMKFTGGKGAQGIGGPSHKVDDAVAPWITGKWNELLHPRDKQGQWAKSANVAGKTLYRGGTSENPHGTYLTTDKKWAAGYGEVSAFKVNPKARMFDLNHPKAHETWGKGWYPAGKTPSEKDRADIFRHAGLQGDDALRPEIHANIKAAGFHGIVHTADKQTRAFMYPGHASKIEEYPDLTKIGGPAFESWTPPQTDPEWAHVSGQNHGINEPPLPDLVQHYQYKDPVSGEIKHHAVQKRLSSGVIMREPDGRTWLIAPTNGFGGYDYTFPKGGVEEGLHPQANAIKEVYEETGMKARITGFAGDYRGDTGTTRMYYGVRETGTPADHGWETQAVALVHAPEAFQKLNRTRDKKIAFDHLLKKHVGDALLFDKFDESKHPRHPKGSGDKGGEFVKKGGGDGTISSDEEGKMVAKILEKKGVNVDHYPPDKTGYDHHTYVVPDENAAMAEATLKSYGYAYGTEETGGFTHFHVPDDSKSVNPSPAESDPWAIDPKMLNKVADKMGSNKGGVYEDPTTKAKYYVKFPPTKDHVTNELMAAKLYHLAGVNTKEFIPSLEGDAVVTKFVPLNKNNISKFNADERHEAQKHFGAHAWLANWDAAGTGGDNQVIDQHGKVMTVDTGGALKYRAQGTPKGGDYGTKVNETKTMLDHNKSPDAAGLYGNMTDQQKYESYKRVTDIPDQAIIDTVHNAGGTWEDAEKLLLRKKDLFDQQNALATKLNNEVSAKEKQDKINKSWEPTEPSAMAAHAAMEAQWEKKYPKAPEPDHDSIAAGLVPAPKGYAKMAAEAEAAVKGTPTFKTKAEHAAYLLKKGTTIPEILKMTGWNTVSMPQTAHNANLKLQKIKGDDGVTYYKGTPMTADEIKNKGKKPAPTYNTKATKAETEALKAAPAAPKTAAELNAEGAFDYIKPTPAASAFASTAEPGHIKTFVEGKTLATAMKNQNINVFHSPPKPDIGVHYHSYDVSPADEDKTIALLNKVGYKYKLDTTSSKTSTFTISTEQAPTPVGSDTTVNAFKTALGVAGVKYEHIEGKLYHHITPEKFNADFVKHYIAKKHPGVVDNQDGSFSIKKDDYDAVKAAEAKTYDINKPSDVFEQMLKQEGIKYGSSVDTTGTLFNIMSNHDLVETAAKYHPDAQKLGKFEYYVPHDKYSSQPVPTPTPPTLDLSTPHGAFKAALEAKGVDAMMTKGKSSGEAGHFIEVLNNHDKSAAAEVAKQHPAAKKMSSHQYFVPEDTTPSIAELQKSVSFDPPHVQAFTQDLKNMQLTVASVESGTHYGVPGYFIEVKPEAGSIALSADVAQKHPDATYTDLHTYFMPLKPAAATKSLPTLAELKAAAPAPTPTATPEPTEAELTKAKKNAKLQAQYVPGMPAGHPEAEKLLAAFNTKYEGKTITDPKELAIKVADFKKLQADMIPFMNEQQKKEAIAKAEHAKKLAVAAKEQAEAEQAAKDAAEAEHQAKLADPEYVKKQAEIKEQYDKLHSIGVSSTKNLDATFASYIKKAHAKGATINGADAAYIDAYKHSAYINLNENLWKQENIAVKQGIYAKALETALNKMPSYAGTAERGVTTKGAFERYAANVGQVVTEHGFSSYGATHKLWGSEAVIHLVAKDLKDIRSFNPSEGGGELILQRGSLLHIIKVDKKTRHVWAEQI